MFRRKQRFIVTCLSLSGLANPRTALAQEAGAPDQATRANKEAGPAATPQVVVHGRVLEQGSTRPVAAAWVIDLVGTERTLSDADGRFSIRVPAGKVELRVFAAKHRPRRVRGTTKMATTEWSIPIENQAYQGDPNIVVVEMEVEHASAVAQLEIRKKAIVSADGISAQDIAKAPDRNAADAAKRIVGASVSEGKYVFVRGLGGRYTNALLNGGLLPSPEPDKQAIPLDLFPSAVLAAISISKTAAPDMPGDFAGGLVNIETRDMPTKFQVLGTINMGINGQTTFRERLSYQGGGLDWLGIDDGTRALPTSIPEERVVRIGRTGKLNPHFDQYGRDINGPMGTTRSSSAPNGSASLVLGDSYTFGPAHDRVFGWQAAAQYGRRFIRRTGEILRTFTVDDPHTGSLRRLNDYQAETGSDNVSWSSMLGATYRHGPNHWVSWLGIVSRSSENEARRITGYNEERASGIDDVRLRFVSRQLLYGQLRGGHRFPNTMGTKVEWNASVSKAALNEPNTRETIYAIDPVSGPVYLDTTLSGLHFYADQSESAGGANVHVLQPLSEDASASTLKAGAWLAMKNRAFNARRFRFIRTGKDPSVYSKPVDELFTDDHVGTSLTLEEYTRPNDAYKASHDVVAGYAMSDTRLSSSVRLIGGARVESSRQSIDSFDPFASGKVGVKSSLDRVDWMPSAHLVWRPTEQVAVRASASKTVARPQLRELAPFSFTDYFGARDIQGNPNLDRTQIGNGDLRVEWFPRSGEVLAATGFVKVLDKPIEPVIIPTNNGVVTFQNAGTATLYGLELELRKRLDTASSLLKDFTLFSNVSFIQSRVSLPVGEGFVQTSSVRALAGQSPFVLNAALDYERVRSGTRLRILYNVAGPKIDQVGQLGLPDVYERPRHQLDLSVAQRLTRHLDLKMSLENMLDSPYAFTQGSKDDAPLVGQYRNGATYWASLTLSN